MKRFYMKLITILLSIVIMGGNLLNGWGGLMISIGTVIADRFSDGDIHGDGAHGAHETARTYGIAHRLINAVSFRRVDVAFHLVKGAGQDGDDDKIRAGQGLLQRIRHSILPV